MAVTMLMILCNDFTEYYQIPSQYNTDSNGQYSAHYASNDLLNSIKFRRSAIQ